MGKGTGVAEIRPFFAVSGRMTKMMYYSLKTWNLITLPNLVCSPLISTRFVPVYLSSTCTYTTKPCFHQCSNNKWFQSNSINTKLRNKSFACKLLALGFCRHWDRGKQRTVLQWGFSRLIPVRMKYKLLFSWGSDIFTSSMHHVFETICLYTLFYFEWKRKKEHLGNAILN